MLQTGDSSPGLFWMQEDIQMVLIKFTISVQRDGKSVAEINSPNGILAVSQSYPYLFCSSCRVEFCCWVNPESPSISLCPKKDELWFADFFGPAWNFISLEEHSTSVSKLKCTNLKNFK